MFSSGPYFWESNINGGGLIINADTNQFELFQHIYAPEETGGVGRLLRTSDRPHLQRVGRTARHGRKRQQLGLRHLLRPFADTISTTRIRGPWPVPVNQFFENQFLGPKLGTYYGYPIYSPNIANFYKAITPAQYASFIGFIDTKSETWTQNLNMQVNNTDFFQMPAGAAGVAGIVASGQSGMDQPDRSSRHRGRLLRFDRHVRRRYPQQLCGRRWNCAYRSSAC